MSKENNDEKQVSRPPIVTFLGHVDHGKTSLLSKIKEQDLNQGEFGGISQHTNAYQVEKEFEGELKKITFIDTPGHAAFSQMRSRGGKIADLVVLVVAADDGVQPQTKEAIAYAREAGVPTMVALNKVDLVHVRLDKVKKELAEVDLTPEEWGGQTTVVEVSAKTGQGVDELLEMIFLWAETSGLSADPAGEFSGVVFESHLDPRRGPIANVLVQSGTLKIGTDICAGETSARVKALFLEGNRISEAGPSTPVEILGFSEIPEVGEKVCRQQVENAPKRVAQSARRAPIVGGEKLLDVVLKADTVGTSQAVEAAVESIVVGDFKVRILQSGIGEITDSDVRLAVDSGAHIFAFNIGFSLGAESLAKELNVEIGCYNIIYQLIKGVTDALETKKAVFEGGLSGMGEVIKVFMLPLSKDRIAGTRILTGTVVVGNRVTVSRDGEDIHKGKIKAIHLEKDEIKKAERGLEVGLYIKPQWGVKVGDVIEVI